MTLTIARVERAARDAGLTPRGAFHPRPEDGVPEAGPGTPAGTIVLLGNAGPAMWAAFTAARDPERDLLDDWSAAVIGGLARDLGGRACFPFDTPAPPFQRWAARAEACAASPLGIFIHPDYGLWHGYRGALVFAEVLDLPTVPAGASPCETCAGQPCLSACPVDAFTPGYYDIAACAGHLESAAGEDCMALGCRARRACPVGTGYTYAPDQAAFHMRAFLRVLGRG